MSDVNRLPPEDRLPAPPKLDPTKVYLNPAPPRKPFYEVGQPVVGRPIELNNLEEFSVSLEVPAWLQGDLECAVRIDVITMDGVPHTWNAFSPPFTVKRGPYMIHMPAFGLMGAVGKTEDDVRSAINGMLVACWGAVVKSLMLTVSPPESNPDPDGTKLYVYADIEKNQTRVTRTPDERGPHQLVSGQLGQDPPA